MYSINCLVISALTVSFACGLNSSVYALASSIPSEELEADSEILVAIQWHICALIGSARDVASGSVRMRVYVLLVASVRVGDSVEVEESEWISKAGVEEVSEGDILFPKETVL